MHYLSHSVAALSLASSVTAAVLNSKRAAPAAPSGYTTIFQDSFSGADGTAPNSNDWLLSTGTQYPNGPAQWGTGEIETYTNKPANVKQTGGKGLWITPIRDSSGKWTSARVETKRSDFMAPAGKKMLIKASIQLPNITPDNGAGIWPAFWTLGKGYRTGEMPWPAVGEFDILESVNGKETAYTTMHCGVNPGGPCNEPSGIGLGKACPTGTCYGGTYHTFAVEVDRSVTPETVKFVVDDVTSRKISASTVNNSTVWNNAVHNGHFILLNVAVGGAFPNGVAKETTPNANTVSGKEMRVDWVAVYYST